MQADSFIENYRFLARYNRWFNARLYAACGGLSEAERKVDRGAFFGSIHATLNHVVWADRLWLQRFAAQGEAFTMLNAELLAVPKGAKHATVLYEDWDALRRVREELDVAIEEWTGAFTPEFVNATMRYRNTRGDAREHATWMALTHFFNHQTHHRGQVTDMLMQAGLDVGITDLIALA
jgi:uncharacterized damage-inducible protein DinB